MGINQTERGFDYTKFTDRNSLQCSLQLSSLATEEAIWIGIDNPKLTIFQDESFGKYETVEMPKLYMVDSRMHLTREMVAELLPHLISFARNGELNEPILEDSYSPDGVIENMLYDAECFDLDNIEEAIKFFRRKYNVTRRRETQV